MMGLGLYVAQTLGVEQRLVQELLLLDLRGGTSVNIFPEVETLILRTKAIRLALTAIDYGDEEVADYASFMDFFITSLIHEFRPYCFAFYRNEGKPLRDLVTESGRLTIETLLYGAIEVALMAHENGMSIDWSYVRRVLDVELQLPPIYFFPSGFGPLQELADCA